MKYIRTIEQKLLDNIAEKPIIVLYGARQVGKTTLIKSILEQFSNGLYLQGDDPKDAALLEGRGAKELGQLVAGHELVVIDEAQRVRDIGIILKLIADNVPGVQMIASGSSSFELANKVSEPLTGRNRKIHLYPLSIPEVVASYGKVAVMQKLEDYLIFGMYPQIVNAESRERKAILIRELASDYLFKDLFLFGDIRNSFAFEKLVKLLALRVGSEISYNELAKEVGISRETVNAYITLLEQAFIVFRLTPFYTNKTKEINKSHKIYFYDTGMRNALISNTDPLEMRLDRGAILENFFIAEKVKERSYAGRDTTIHFWRNRQGAEVDFVENKSSSGKLEAFECKWKDGVSAPLSFSALYPQATFSVVTHKTIVDVLLKGSTNTIPK
ncbi:MAG: ATP-binding protein [Candidatus Paceibacterota bacterium]|jgi:hypothetical protein